MHKQDNDGTKVCITAATAAILFQGPERVVV